MIRISATIVFAVYLLAGSSLSTAVHSRPIEGRAVWMDAGAIPKTRSEIAKLVQNYADAGINILMPEVIRRGYTIYPSKIGMRDPSFVSFDPLGVLIDEAHKNKMEVHPWVWVFRVGHTTEMGGILKQHPEWAALSKAGENVSPGGGRWLCPSIPDAREYLRALYTELAVKYPIDGLHLDYVRFENENPIPYCYNDSCRSRFKADSGIDPMDIDPLSRKQIDWNRWRERQISTFVQAVTQDMRRVRPDIKVSAAVASDPVGARLDYMQNWGNWTVNSWIDFLCPMSYTTDTTKLQNMAIDELNHVDWTTLLFSGIGVHLHKTPETTLSQIDAVRGLAIPGTALFASSYLKPPFIDALKNGPFASKTLVPFRVSRQELDKIVRGGAPGKPKPTLGDIRDAANLLVYNDYRSTPWPYVPPTEPPLNLPPVVQPLPSLAVAKTPSRPTIDGQLNDAAWQNAATVALHWTNTGATAPVSTEAKLAYDDTALYVAYTADEPEMAELKAAETKRDGPAFYDDSIEIFLDTTGQRKSYVQLSANTLGTQFDQKLMTPAWNAKWQSAASKNEDSWTIEVAIPFSELGVSTPKPGDTWTANLARNRWVTGKPEYLVWSVPYGSYNRMYRFGVLTFGE